MRPAALLLDLDGTLVDSEPLQREGYRRFFAARGWPEPDLSLFTGRRGEDVFGTEPGPWQGHDPLALAREVRALVPRDVPPAEVPGGRALVAAACERGIRVAVVTSAGPGWVALALGEGLGLRDQIDVLVTARDVSHGKPHPEGYLLACTLLGLEPASTLAAEDSVAGVTAAAAAGVGRVLGITTSRPADELLAAGAEATYADLRPALQALA